MPLRKKTPPPPNMVSKKSDPELGEREKRSKWNPFHSSKDREKDKDKRKSQEVDSSNPANAVLLARDSGYGESENVSSEPSTNTNSLVGAGSGATSQNSAVSPMSGGPAVSQETHHDPATGTTITTTTTTTTTTITTSGPGGTHTIAMPNSQVPHSSVVQTSHPPSPAPTPHNLDPNRMNVPPAQPQRNPSASRNVQFLGPGYQPQNARPEGVQQPQHDHVHHCCTPHANTVHSPLTPPLPLRSSQRNSRELGYFPGPPPLANSHQPTSQAPPPQPPRPPIPSYTPLPPGSESNSTDSDFNSNRLSSQSFVSRDDHHHNHSGGREYAAIPPAPITPNSPTTRQHFSYPGRAQPIPPQEMPADEMGPQRIESFRQEHGQRLKEKGKLQSLRSAAVGLHGAGEALRGTINSSIDKRLNPHDEERLAMHREVVARGRQEMQTRKFSRSREREVDPNSTAGRFHSMVQSRLGPKEGGGGGGGSVSGDTDGAGSEAGDGGRWAVPRKQVGGVFR